MLQLISSTMVSLICAAIDIGTTYSGYAFSSIKNYEIDPTNIQIPIWIGSKLLSLKTPTAVLLDGRQEFVAFGYEAENKYSELVADGEHENYFYFHRFKMLLHEMKITGDIKIKDETGKEMKALIVFQYAIQFLKDHLYKRLSDKIACIKEHDLHYVLTVPALCDDFAKQFMTEAAINAGIRSKQLSIITEQEAAFTYCQYLKSDRQDAKDKNVFAVTVKPGVKYMVVDLGGGTSDIYIHQRSADGTLKEVVHVSGGPWGGKSVDEAFHCFLERIFGPNVMEELKKEELEDYIDLFREFETKKRSIQVDQTTTVDVILPVSLIDLVKRHKGKIQTALEQSPYGQAVSYSKQRLHISPETFRDLFKPTIDALIKHMEMIFRDKKLSNLENLIIVGGFSECKLIQDKIRQEQFVKATKIFIPKEAGLAVLKGAVIYGHKPKAKVLRRTYGILCWPKWDPKMHPQSKKVTLGGATRCKDVFYKYVQVGQQVEPGQEESHVIKVLNPDERTLKCIIYTSTDPNPRYVTDPSCQRLGNLIIPLPELKPGQIVEIEESMIFGDTELLVRARDLQTGTVVDALFDLL